MFFNKDVPLNSSEPKNQQQNPKLIMNILFLILNNWVIKEDC